MIVKLLTEQHFEFLSLKGGCRGSSESTHVKTPHCWKSHALAQLKCKFVNAGVKPGHRPMPNGQFERLPPSNTGINVVYMF